MALDKTTLKDAIKMAMLNNLTDASSKQITEIETLAGAFADSIDAFVKGIQITYTTGLATPSGGGAVAGTFQYTIS